MKRFNIAYLLLAFLLEGALSACSSDDSEDIYDSYTRKSEMSVTSANVIFDAGGGEGTITVEAPGDISISYNATWYTATTNGHTINVKSNLNDNLDSRSSQITIYSGQDSAHVTVQQKGLVVKFDGDASVGLADQNGAIAYNFKHNTPINITTSEKWLHAELNGDSLYLSSDNNNTGHIRSGWVKYGVGAFVDSIEVRQFDYDKDIAGKYTMTYDDDMGNSVSTTATFGYNNEGHTAITLDELGIAIPMTVAPNGIMTINGAEYSGIYHEPTSKTDYYTFSTFLTDGTGIVTSADLNVETPFLYREGYGTYTDIQPTINWSAVGATYSGWTITLCKNKSLDYGSYIGSILTFYNPLFVKK